MIDSSIMRKALIVAAFALVLTAPAWAADANSQCLMCHSAPDLTKTSESGHQQSLHVDSAEFKASIHGSRACTDCHADLAGQSLPHKAEVQPVQCSRCHSTEHDTYAGSIHGKAAANGDGDVPKCQDCHGTHNIRSMSDAKSMVYRSNIPKTCSKCHSDSKLAAKHNIPMKQTLKYYENSVHGHELNEKGNLGAAVCTDCHGSHDVKAAADPTASINRANVPATCGRCHSDIYKRYETGIHGQAVAHGIKDAPVCTDCHGEHTIQRPSQPGSSVYPTHVVATCSKCHENKRVARMYGLPANRLSSYLESYHGVANKMGETTVANCATCHGAHDILPSKDPRSAVAKKNLPHTCGKCHPGAGANFAKGTIHLAPTVKNDRLIYLVKIFYTLFVTGLIGSFSLYIVMDLFSRWKRRGRVHGH